MRLIDANALMAEMHNIILEDGEDRRTFYEVIERQPTIEPQRMRGKWEYLDYGGVGNYHCSACRRICVNKGDYDFCPFCGAYLRVQDDES